MKKKLIAAAILMFAGLASQAQTSRVGCNDKAIRYQSELVKNEFKAQGMVITRDAMVNMDSKQPFPVGIQLIKGRQYTFIFVGDRRSSKMSFELFDGEDKRIEEKVIKTPGENNTLVYSFIPSKTDLYLVVLMQTKKKDEMCGSFTMMEKPEGSPIKATPPTIPPAQH